MSLSAAPPDEPRSDSGAPYQHSTRRTAAAVDAAVRAAAITLFYRDGLDRLTMEAIAREAAVEKTSIYRRWPSKELLLLDARTHDGGPLVGGVDIDSGSVVLSIVRHAARVLSDPVIAALLLRMVDDDAPAVLRTRVADAVVVPLRSACRDASGEAIQRGELTADADMSLICSIIRGALVGRLVFGEPIDDDFIERLAGFIRVREQDSPS